MSNLINPLFMKALSILVIFLLINGVIYPQDTKQNSKLVIGLYTNIGINQPFPAQRSNAYYEPDRFYGRGSYSAGIMFTKPIGQKYKISVAAVYSVHKIGFKYSMVPSPTGGIPNENFEVFNVPITISRYLRNNWFLNLGTITDFDVPRNAQYLGPQTGFGLSFGGGKEFQIKNFSLDISPNFEIHSIVPFQPRETKERLAVFGIRIGLSNN
jgi:hypothetical protein